MKNRRALIVLLSVYILSIGLCGITDAGAQERKVLLIAREGSVAPGEMVDQELTVMKDLMEKSGLTVVISTSTGRELLSASRSIKPNYKLSEIDPSEYQGVIIACMAAGRPGQIPLEALKIVKFIFSKGLPVAAQDGAVCILADAGILKGKKYALYKQIFYIRDGIYSGRGVVVDGNLITSGACPYVAIVHAESPDCTTMLTEKFIEMVKNVK
ncbi:MAG: DJ-1/PfpI family protein [Deltaproteobacteria bacterium]|nr:DJ-1/PfpI family protein [Deltaproteobacteria bacterium]